MLRPEKAELVTSLRQSLSGAAAIIVTQYSGLTVAQMTQLRREARKAGAGLKVAKNRLARLALKDTPFEGMSDLLKGPTAIAYSSDPVAAAKVVADFSKKNDKLILIGGAMGTQQLNAEGVKALASLPSLDQLRATLIGLVNAPATKIARTVAEPGAQLARVVQAYADKAA